jgi:hypothetical protein
VAVRDSKDPDGPSLIVTAGEWQAFLDGMRDVSHFPHSQVPPHLRQ